MRWYEVKLSGSGHNIDSIMECRQRSLDDRGVGWGKGWTEKLCRIGIRDLFKCVGDIDWRSAPASSRCSSYGGFKVNFVPLCTEGSGMMQL